MTTPCTENLPIALVVLRGDDAVTIANNLTTADLRSLAPGDCTETFITEVRGRTIGHVTVRRDPNGLTLIGPAGQSDAITAHVNRYTIREDCTAESIAAATAIVHPPSSTVDDPAAIKTDWLGTNTAVQISSATGGSDPAATDDPMASAEFHDARLHAGFPWWGIDFTEKNLPQEVNRDAAAISFTKGCYLGQETVARLDALGQVQKKLVRLSLQEGQVAVGDKLMLDGKPVARITSVTSDATLAMAMVRRAWFDPGTQVVGINDRTDQTIVAAIMK